MDRIQRRREILDQIFENYKRIKEIDDKIKVLQGDKELLEYYNTFLDDLVKVINSNQVKEGFKDD